MNKEQYSTLIAQLAGQIFAAWLCGENGVDMTTTAAQSRSVEVAKELARLSGVSEPKAGEIVCPVYGTVEECLKHPVIPGEDFHNHIVT